MSEHAPADRLNYTGDLEPVIDRVCEAYGIGAATGHQIIGMGYEDCNVIIDTDSDRFMAKMFAKTRTAEDIQRYSSVMKKVVEAGVHHPELMETSTGEMLFSVSNITMVLMRFIEGKTFFELDRLPDDTERHAILEQAAKINNIDFEPPYLFDSWAIPHIRAMFERVQQYIDPADTLLVEQAMTRYEAIPVKDLPHAFVHGDLIKTNLVKSVDDSIYVLDFSVANWYPRIQELAVIAANLLHDDNGLSLRDRCEQIADEYSQLNPLTPEEREHLYDYALAGVAMEFMGSHQEKYINGNDSEETDYWFRLGREGLRKALA